MNLVVDTSALVGLLVPSDQWHQRAVVLWGLAKVRGYVPVYLDCVLAESVSVIARRLEEKHRAAEIGIVLDRLKAQVPEAALTWVLPDVPRLFWDVLDMMRASAGALNFNDALIALACRERGIAAIASFDKDFDGVDWLRRLAGPAGRAVP